MTRSTSGSIIAEVVPSLAILFLLVFVPLLDLIGVASGAGLLHYFAQETVSRASKQMTFAEALTSMQQNAATMNSGGFAKFAKLEPAGGFASCGMDLFIDACNWRDGKTIVTFPANTPPPPPIDVSTYLYEYRVKTTYTVGPMVSMASYPVLQNIPGLGKPIVFSFNASMPCEHPVELATAAGQIGAFGTLTGTTAASTVPAIGAPPDSGSGWNFPGIYEAIAAKGETVVQTSVFQVYAVNSNWTDTGVNFQSGEKLWVDWWADGQWSLAPIYPSCGPNGYSVNENTGSGAGWVSPQGVPGGGLAGMVGNTIFPALAQATDFVPPTTGEFYMMCCDSGWNANGTVVSPSQYLDNTGCQTVRVIVTR